MNYGSDNSFHDPMKNYAFKNPFSNNGKKWNLECLGNMHKLDSLSKVHDILILGKDRMEKKFTLAIASIVDHHVVHVDLEKSCG
jgi:hypothetical protein